MANKLHEEIVEASRLAPCTTVDDLFVAPARRVMRRLLADFLVKNQLTVIELLHRAELLDRVEGTGTLLQYAVQQTAVARAPHEKRSSQEIIKELNLLVDKLFERVHLDKRNDVFPLLTTTDFPRFAEKQAGNPKGHYILNGALARHLRDAPDWNEKAVRLIAIAEVARPDSEGGKLLISAVDAIFGELLMMPKAVVELVGFKETFAESVMALVNLFLGKTVKGQYRSDQVMPRLTWFLANDALPAARASVAAQIIIQIYALQRLQTDSFDAEMRTFRQITDLLMTGVGDVLRREELIPALEIRSKRFVANECISAGLSNTVLPSEKIEWLLFAENCIVGDRNKQVLVEIAIRTATTDSFKAQYSLTNAPIPVRLQQLAALSAKVRRSGFHEADRKKLAAILDGIAYSLASDAKLFEVIAAKPIGPAEKALVLLQLLERDSFTEGRLSQRARDEIIGYLSQPGFLTGYVERFSKNRTLDPGVVVSELGPRVEKIGISPDDLRELVAA